MARSTLHSLLIGVALEELDRQREDGWHGNYVDADHGTGEVVLDGHFDLDALVEKIGRAALLDAADTVADLRIGPKRNVATPPEIVAHIRRDAEALRGDQ